VGEGELAAVFWVGGQTLVTIIRSILLFRLAALAEIGGVRLIWPGALAG
jgi:hypothetical protein